MNIKPVASPHHIQTTNTTNSSATKQAVIAKLAATMQPPTPQPEPQIVQNQTQVQPEEMGAIQTRQEGNSEESQAVTETPEPKVETPEEAALSRKFAQLARQEKLMRQKVQQQEQQLKAREEALAAREAQMQSTKTEVDLTKYISKDRFKQDPVSALAEAGATYEELTDYMINQQPTDPRVQRTIDQLTAQVEELRQANEQAKKSQAESQTAAYQAAVKQIEMDAKKLVSSDPIAYEAISKTGTVRDVVKLIEDTYHKDGILMSVEEAAQEIEEYLVEENYNMATKIDKIKKRMQQASATPEAFSPAQTPAAAQTKQPQPMKTLTNATSSTRQLSAKERAMLAFKGEKF